MWYSISSFSVKCSISAAAEGILWCSLQLQLFPFSLFFPFCHVSPHCSLLWAFAIKGVYYGGGKKKNHHDPSISTHERVSYNGPRTLGHVCEIIWAVTPSWQGGHKQKPFSCCFTASPMISVPAGWMHFVACAPPIRLGATPRSPCNTTAAFSYKKKKKRPNRCVCCDQFGLPWWMDAGLQIRCQPCETQSGVAEELRSYSLSQ